VALPALSFTLHRMLDWKDFDSVFQPKKDYTPDHKQGEAAIRHRKELGGHLYFDLIWTSLGLKQRK